MPVQFTKHDRDDEIYWVARKPLNNGEFDYWFVMIIQDITHAMSDPPSKYYATLWVIAPDLPTKETIESYMSPLGLNEHEDESVEQFDKPVVAMLLAEAGCGVPVKQIGGNNIAVLERQLRNETELVEMLFGVYMDRPVNRIGTTGWDMLKGEIDAGMKRWKAA